MAGVSSIGQSIGRGIAKATNTRPAQWLGRKFEENPENALAMATVTSIILKDGIGCAMYVTQSLHNKKIPDEKRKFVAALDLTNGVLMIAAQIAMFFAMRKYSGPIFEKLFQKSFNAENKSNLISRIRMWESIKDPSKVAKKSKIEKAYEEVKKDGYDLFKFVADIAAATIIGKRVIVPLIATPLAKKVEKKMNPDENQNDQIQTKPEEQKADKVTEEKIKTEDKTENKQQIQENKLEIDEIQSLNFEHNANTNLLSKYKK